ncbi:DUF2252 family protein [Catenulispora sp. GP43]|uniref:DUF2252 family protein n=1 Tax=Catenulispora sp. GP43 TaxID=3156263 RepID=UPI0035188C1D
MDSRPLPPCPRTGPASRPGRVRDRGRGPRGGRGVGSAGTRCLLGWGQVEGLDGVQRDSYIRQLADWKGSAVIEDMRPRGMAAYGEPCGWTLARARLYRGPHRPLRFRRPAHRRNRGQSHG